MIVFELENIYDGSDWRKVTVDRSPDDIKYSIRYDDWKPIRTYSTLTSLIKLYGCAYCEMGSEAYPSGGGYTVEVRKNHVVVKLRDGRELKTSFAELRSALEPFLSNVFNELDRISDDEKRVLALEYLDELNPFDVKSLYERLST